VHFDAKTHLRQLLDRVELGEQIEITRRGQPVARLVPCEKGASVDSMQTMIAKVREEHGTYGVSKRDIAQWKEEARR